ncbi:C2D1A protein, partial [Nothocercus nigrocapillus]|nr:C2D1A protein [Nothocercus nigrocapillus]
DFSPEGMMANDAGNDAAELEAELLALVGGQPDPKGKPKGKTPLPMETIERMAALCMKDLDEEEGDDEEDLEDEEDLMAELQEVLGEGEEGADVPAPAAKVNEATPDSGSIEAVLVERAAMYRTAIGNAKEAGDASKMRRYERGLKTLENMLSSARKGKQIDEQDIPPPVALGKSSAPAACSVSPPPAASPTVPLPKPQPPPVLPKPLLLPSPALPGASPEEKAPSPSTAPHSAPGGAGTAALLQSRQREYKLAALHAKQQGDMEMATKYFRLAKSFDPLLEAAGKGQPVDPSSIPPSPGRNPSSGNSAEKPGRDAMEVFFPGADIPAAPRDALEALQQRMERYKAAAAQARGKGDDRKARMHERIVKQYQDAIRAHKAGKPVDFSELPVPPGFQPIQGMETPSGEQSLAGVLESAMKLASQEVQEPEEEAEETKQVAFPSWASPGSHCAAVESRDGSGSTGSRDAPAFSFSPAAQQQLAFLEGRKKQLLQAALRAKQKNDIEGAKLFLRQAKGLDPMIEASHSGLPVDITKVPEAPVNKEDFVLVQRRGVSISPEAASQYLELMKLLRQQHEMCVTYSKQFTHLGNIAETTKFERMAEDCKQNMEILKQAHARGFPLPRYHYEQRTFTIVKIFPELNSNDMVLSIVKGINLPAPPGVAPNDLDAFVRFEFPHPNAEEAQKDKTNVIKNTDCPEFNEQFKLYINRGHRGLKRVLQTKGIKFEVAHKGGLFKTDRVVGTAQLKLEALEAACEVREIVELLDGRRPTAGKLEVIVRIREPLSSQQLETRTERWLVINPSTLPPVRPLWGHKSIPCGSRGWALLPASGGTASRLRPLRALTACPSPGQMLVYRQARRQLPNELLEQHQDLLQRSQWLRAQLQHGPPAFRKEYLAQLERYLHLYTESARRLGTEGNRDAAKEALYKRNLVESEVRAAPS